MFAAGEKGAVLGRRIYLLFRKAAAEAINSVKKLKRRR